MLVRAGEDNKSWFRSDRMMHVNENWYFLTRENTQEGPFDSRQEAEAELILYIRHVNDSLFQEDHHQQAS